MKTIQPLHIYLINPHKDAKNKMSALGGKHAGWFEMKVSQIVATDVLQGAITHSEERASHPFLPT